MNMQEMSRLIEGLRLIGLNGDQLADFLMWIENGAEQYKPQSIIQQEQK